MGPTVGDEAWFSLKHCENPSTLIKLCSVDVCGLNLRLADVT